MVELHNLISLAAVKKRACKKSLWKELNLHCMTDFMMIYMYIAKVHGPKIGNSRRM
jgi:hypothetical protein